MRWKDKLMEEWLNLNFFKVGDIISTDDFKSASSGYSFSLYFFLFLLKKTPRSMIILQRAITVFYYQLKGSRFCTNHNPCPTEPGYMSYIENTVDPDQRASDEAI